MHSNLPFFFLLFPLSALSNPLRNHLSLRLTLSTAFTNHLYLGSRFHKWKISFDGPAAGCEVCVQAY